ncbi:MAG: DinB family protein [Caldilineaceae bacterium SB0675_bin_29]|uniref:DinB family protein n=1 Tax=Caldilineaceae bacterium SB0675_bin_29 TaxID=2605266 RepID=A0A6B1G421_9CHLR|nr:DinB family protein [Caldilineaceae bacterium SB0675_bin_29]
MDVSRSVTSQFHAVLSMMEQTVRLCPAEMWDAPGLANPFWRVAYHALYVAIQYLQPTEHEPVRWQRAREGYQFLAPSPAPPYTPQPQADRPYSRNDMLDLIDFSRAEVDRTVPTIDFSASSGFHWLPFDKLELQLYNIRHLQHHVGDLSTLLQTQAGLETDWVKIGSAPATD